MTVHNDPLLDLLRSQLTGNESKAEIERLVLAVAEGLGIDEKQAIAIAIQLANEQEFRHVQVNVEASGSAVSGSAVSGSAASGSDCEPLPASASAGSPSDVPRLLIDWGQDLHVGWQACPACHLICSAEYKTAPRVVVQLDDRLDHDPRAEKPELRSVDLGLWAFHIPFALTTQGTNCRPGQYLISISVELPSVNRDSPRFYYSQIRLKVLDPASSSAKTLEIEGDGQSLVNLQGRDLRSFAKVVLKGSGSAVLNVQEALFPSKLDDDVSLPRDPDRDGSNQYEYELRPDSSKAIVRPFLSTRFITHDVRDTAMLVLEDGKQIVLIARRKVKLGRNRENDIVTRFLPRSLANDELSRNLSREHVGMQLTDDGFQVSDLGSRTGSKWDGRALTAPQLLTASDLEERFRLAMAWEGVDVSFQAEVELFGDPSRDRQKIQPFSQPDLESLGIVGSRLNRLSMMTQIHAVRIRRLSNLADREEYVLVFGAVQVGPSHQAAITLSDSTCDPMAALLFHTDRGFWLQSTAHQPIEIDGCLIALNECLPLVVGMKIKIGETKIRFLQSQQLYLHDS
jgi:hypothetical protein